MAEGGMVFFLMTILNCSQDVTSTWSTCKKQVQGSFVTAFKGHFCWKFSRTCFHRVAEHWWTLNYLGFLTHPEKPMHKSSKWGIIFSRKNESKKVPSRKLTYPMHISPLEKENHYLQKSRRISWNISTQIENSRVPKMSCWSLGSMVGVSPINTAYL